MERRLEWAESRDRKSAAGFDKAHTLGNIMQGEPVKLYHHSAGRHLRDIDRQDSAMRQGCESLKMAELHRSKAAGIESALERSIFSDDEDAVERLRERITGLEAERDRITTYNKSARVAARTGGMADQSVLTEAERKDLASVARFCAYQIRPGGGFPAYKSSNLSGNINRLKKRLAGIEKAVVK